MSNCLVIIDVQNYFINKHTKHVIPRIQELTKNQKFDHVVATRFMNHEESPYVKLLNWRKMIDKESHTIPGNITKLAEKIFEKDHYSCFTPELRNFLKESNIDKLYFVGMDTDCCVLKSAADAFELGISPFVIEDCCASHYGKSNHRAGIKVLERLIARRVIKAKDFSKKEPREK